MCKSQSCTTSLQVITPELEIDPGTCMDIAYAVKRSKTAYAKYKDAGCPADPNHPATVQRILCKKELRHLQRMYAAKQREDEYTTIMQAADDHDDQLFFRLIRKQRKTNSEGDELMVDGCLITDKEAIRGCWADYFEDLSTAKDDPTFDNMHQNMVDIDIDVECIREKLKDLVPSEEISTDEVMRAMKAQPWKSLWQIGFGSRTYYPYAAQSLAPVLARLFTTMLKQGQIPGLLMDGYIIPIAKKAKIPCFRIIIGG